MEVAVGESFMRGWWPFCVIKSKGQVSIIERKMNAKEATIPNSPWLGYRSIG